ncbi:MAG: hypothetical protein EU536_00730 [Promethearchaeota archaeon]|nr:MAG: hypothetical protein EU536_00730 [Candidatus Lokiarchaeota archaeon]
MMGEPMKRIIAVTTILVGVSWAIAFPLPPPIRPCPLPDYTCGYAFLNFVDLQTHTPVTNVTVYLSYAGNGTLYNCTISGELVYIPETSLYFASKAGYWNASGVVYATESLHTCPIFVLPCPPLDPYFNMTGSLIQVCPKSAVRVNITAINGTNGTYTSADIPDGHPLATYNVGSVNATYLTSFSQMGQVTIEADFSAIHGAHLYFGLLDAVDQHMIPL